MDIYLPSVDSVQDAALPVLYLIHGINGYEGSWQERGHAIDTLERLMAEGKCPPMIVVMPDCNKWPYKPHPGKKNLWRYLMRYNRISHEHDIEQSVCELMDMIDSTYCVSGCMIAGLSDGARIAVNVAKLRPERFAAVGMFSPVVHKAQLPGDSIQYSAFSIQIYVGKSDFFYPNAKRYHKQLKKMNYPHQWIILSGQHDWPVWREGLSLFLQEMDSTIGK